MSAAPRESAPESEVNPHENVVLAFETADRASFPPQGAILLVGDSQFSRWNSLHEDLPGYSLINRGIDSSYMSDVLHFTDRIVLPYNPRLIVVHEGGNDVHAGKSPEQVVTDMRAFVDKVRPVLPSVPIAFSSLTPSPARWEEALIRRRANRMIKDYAGSQKGLIFIDLFDGYLGTDSRPREELFLEDHLHHSHAGYLVRVRLSRPYLGEPDVKTK